VSCSLNAPVEPRFPETGDPGCCEGAAILGPHRCTCWQPVFDLEQAPVDQETLALLNAGVEPNTRRRMCEDNQAGDRGCAYRPGSPERNGDPHFQGDAEFLENLAAQDRRFWCHQGMRKITAWRHPSGMEIPDEPGAAYDPPIVGNVPWKADGTPGELCAGWAARRRALAAKDNR
jgi:hypothetical protein